MYFEQHRKHCGKRRKCWLPAFSPFPTMFSRAFSFGVVKSRVVWYRVNSFFFYTLANDKILDYPKLKPFADDKINVTQKWKLPAFSPFPTMFSKAFFFRVDKSRDCVVKSESSSYKNATGQGNQPTSSVYSKRAMSLLEFICPILPEPAEPHSSVGRVADLRTGDCWFDSRLGQYSFKGLKIVIETGFILLSLQSVVSTLIMWESSH